ncbi:MAG: hypothetical protein UU54_C0004G0010 [Candidatus Yanofskybacteria bacterium GW2011_GWA2_41_22]|uniref:TraC-like domain-containing protein n=5 Tax=Parcubacteria group TaxID=1794811 RepID=A0A1F8HUR1_9BACT|nr:MAG: hypothetical protein UU54_C0004G0010 [Candidatus Yanofskybacteria bacterium GW2011_GWA2_41_22]KKS25766.1 MAG: hypothetical protein UU83_C0002G0014 [Candidatus Jorgensenbacteria bacterium GW2011_GWF2_41_8]KKS27661.1 MAG: hypothetical protein UU84_C0002G0014 [Candidatus Yanofskybacteria bacterium GW2011_GWC2_41_9]OGN00077.1 MAG: hypothetical protein A2736_01560 [Candidatus Yanofskybacteria bacterium RIFCSPHIGHO2_01_FULL_41_27]OGN08764.1 MAG: hypothetical protein A3C64_02030 [Candidatus Ya
MSIQSTKQLVEVADIRDNVVFLKNGSLRAVIEVSATNFELKSEAEQTAILQNFQNFLNSIDFSLQIVINSRKLDIGDYLKLVDTATNELTNELLKIQAGEYAKFVKELAELANIMTKKFYIVVPFYVFEAPGKTGLLKSLTSIIKPSTAVKQISDEQFKTYQGQLLQRVELTLDSLIGVGVKAKVLEKDELMKIYYEIYNPTSKFTQENLNTGI